MRNIYFVISLIIMITLLGCATSVKVTKMGNNRYEINVDTATTATPYEAFDGKAKEVCPHGYKEVIDRRHLGTAYAYLIGTIECE